MKKGVMIVFLANIINMIFSIVTNFILPKYLSIESYGYYKTFQLYINYLGITHLGFVDGIYLKYGGQKIEDIDFNEILTSTATIRNMQIVLTLFALVIGIYLQNPIFILLALSCVPINMISFYKNLYQATGEFKDYGIILSVLPMIVFICNVILLLIFKTDNYLLYILVTFGANMLLYLLLEYKNNNMFGKVRILAFDFKLFKENIKLGMTLTIGNFASIMITSIDRWCIQAWMEISEFSYYSFAVSVENLFNVCVSAVTTTLYNYLCKVKEIEKIVKLKSICTFMGLYLVMVAFPVKFIIMNWLIKYISSIYCLFILICAHSFYFVIKAIYVNLYKARGRQKYYLYQMILILVIATITNLISYFCISKTKESFAYASLFTAIVWYFICYNDLKEIQGRSAENILMLLCSMIFLICGIKINNAIIGMSVYFIFVSGLSFFLCKKDFLDFFKLGISYSIPLIKKIKGSR